MNPVVFITGASSGIGEALAKNYAKQKMRLVLFARRKERLSELEKQLSTYTEVLIAEGDVSSKEDLGRAVENALKRFGQIDIVIANAGFGVIGYFENLCIEDYRRQFETNFFGVLNTCYATLGALKKTKGRFVVMGSVNGFYALPQTSAYGASKFALKGFCQALYAELAPAGVSVTHICPGFVTTEIRRVNNRGNLVESAKDPIPLWLHMPVDKAASQMVRAIENRKREVIITFHGKVIVFFQNHFSWFLNALAKMLQIQGRSEAKAKSS